MKLTKLELHGFKSFADKTQLHFDAGATVIVGPNGCGKSNIVDAFKWVLGEQSAKSLRGDGMQDVIFNGSSGRKPAGMAEIVLTFDNSDGRLPVEQREVSVGRRLYRDGTSEYLLNKQPVRLRDIRELFMDTGVGVDAYSLVEQGKVDQVLASNTIERRAIFEEAAGISKYRSRKREAARKLERVEQNLLRLTDIIGEVDRRLRAIRAAATKARNYQELSHRLRELRVSHFVWEYHKLTASLTEAAARVAACGEAVAALSASQSDAQLRLAELDERQINVASELAEVENRLVQIASQMANHQDRIRFSAEREKELAHELDRRRGTMISLRRRLGELSAQDAEQSAAAEQLDASAETARSQIEAVARDQHAAEIEMHELADQAARASDALFEVMRATANLNNQLQQHKTAQENLGAQKSRLSVRAAELDSQLSQRQAERTQLRTDLAAAEGRLTELNVRLEQTRSAAADKDAAIRQIGGRLAELKERRSSATGRRDLLASLEQRLEGIADGPRALLGAQAEYEKSQPANSELPHIDGLAGLVADLLMAASADATAPLQAALGDREQWLVVRRADSLESPAARQLLDSLPGQAHLLCLDRISPATPDLAPWLGRPGVIGRASDLALCEPVFFGVRDYLLGWTVLVGTLADGLRLANESLNNSRVQFMTRDGYVVTADGRVVVQARPRASAHGSGAQDSSAALGLIGRKAELRELNAQLEALAGQVAQLDSELTAESAEAAQLERVQQELRTAIYQASTERVECTARLRQTEQAVDACKAEQSLVASEIGDLAARIEKAAAAERAAVEAIGQQEQRRLAVQRQSDELAARLTARRTSADSLNRTMTEAKVALSQAEERRRAVRQQLASVRRNLEEARVQQAGAQSDCRSLRQRIEQAIAAQLAGGAAISELFLGKQEASERRVTLARELEQVRRTLSELNASAKAAGFELHAAEESLHQAQVAQNELHVRREDLVQRVADEHQIDLPKLHETDPPAAEKASIDWAAIEAEIAELRGRIERLGVVNLEAIEEQQQLETRSNFLHEQLADVAGAKEQLGELIERINTESRRRFEASFVQIQEHFRELFRKLFGGGKADLVLEDPADLLESGIEIIARPPGKELRSISLLSGGEKTMTALALLLAIFRSRPSPFCILDEVDAALDEANNERFNSLINEFLQFSQFIVITHSKQTMTVADVLYGITMQEQGVSKQVAVRFDGKSVHGPDGEDLERESAVA